MSLSFTAAPTSLSDTNRAGGTEGSPYRRHIPALDGIRGFAVIAVMASHLFYANYTNAAPWQQDVAAMLRFGASGVDLFFALSGFLITGILVDSLEDERFFRKFYARRTLRIFPLYYAVIVVFLGLAVAGRQYGGQLASLALYLQNTHRITVPIFQYAGHDPLPLEHFWSLAVEEQFYLVWPLVVFLLRRRKSILAACFAGAALSGILRWYFMDRGWSYELIHATTACRLDTLLGGGALALLLRGRAHDSVLRLCPWVFAGGVMLIVAMDYLPFGVGPAFAQTALGLLYSVAAAAFIGTTLRGGGWLKQAFSWGWLRVFGKYSYGLYVLHFILGAVLQEPLRHWLAVHVTSSRVLVVGLSGLLEGVISFGAAYLCFHLYEKQFLRLKRYFDYRPHPNTAPGTL